MDLQFKQYNNKLKKIKKFFKNYKTQLKMNFLKTDKLNN